jgi:hypothetical protein
MFTLITRWKDQSRRRARYEALRDQIAALSPAEALDIGIHPLNAASIAREAVYGRA